MRDIAGKSPGVETSGTRNKFRLMMVSQMLVRMIGKVFLRVRVALMPPLEEDNDDKVAARCANRR